MKEAFFECSACNNTITVELERGVIAEPTVCPKCSAQKSYELIHNRSKFADRQMIKLQETPESIPDGQTPQTVLAYAYDEMVDSVQPGDRCVILSCGRLIICYILFGKRLAFVMFLFVASFLHGCYRPE